MIIFAYINMIKRFIFIVNRISFFIREGKNYMKVKKVDKL